MKVIAYGSLLSRASLESVVKRPAPLSKVIVPGWKRVFNAAFDPYGYANILLAAESTIEGAYFELDPAEVRLFDEREAGSELIEVMPGFLAFVWPEEYCRELPVLQSYLAVCTGGAAEAGVDFARGTDWPGAVVDDSADPWYR